LLDVNARSATGGARLPNRDDAVLAERS